MPSRRLDVRELPAPEPLERILAELETLPDGVELEVVHGREPLLLYPILDERGWLYQTRFDNETRSFRILIRRGGT